MRKSTLCIIATIVAILFLNIQAYADSCFKMIDVESRDGASFFAYSINANGQVVGGCESACNNDPPLAVIGIEN